MKFKIVFLIILMLQQSAFALALKQLKLLDTLHLESTGDNVISKIVFSPDEQHILSLVAINSLPQVDQVDFWDVSTGLRLWSWKYTTSKDEDSISNLRFNSESVIQVSSDNSVIELNARTGKQIGRTIQAPLSIKQKLIKKLNIKPENLTAYAESQNIFAYTLGVSRETILYDYKIGREVARLKEFHGNVQLLKFSPDGTKLAVWRNDQRVSLWDVQKSLKIFNFRNNNRYFTDFYLEWSGDSNLLMIQSGNEINVWNSLTGLRVGQYIENSNIYASTLTLSGKKIAVSADFGFILVKGLNDKYLKKIGFKVSKTEFSKDSEILAIASDDGRIHIYKNDLNNYKLQDVINLENEIQSMLFIKNQKLIIMTYKFPYDKKLNVYDLKTRKLIRYSLPENTYFNSIYATSDANHVLIGSYLFNIDQGLFEDQNYVGFNESQPRPLLNRVLYWDDNSHMLIMSDLSLNSRTILWKRSWFNPNPNSNLTLPNWSESGKLLAASWLKDKIIVLDAQSGKTKFLLSSTHNGQPDLKPIIKKLLFSPNDLFLVASYSDYSVHYFELKTRTELVAPPELRTAREIQFTPDGHALMTISDQGLYFWGMTGQNVFGF